MNITWLIKFYRFYLEHKLIIAAIFSLPELVLGGWVLKKWSKNEPRRESYLLLCAISLILLWISYILNFNLATLIFFGETIFHIAILIILILVGNKEKSVDSLIDYYINYEPDENIHNFRSWMQEKIDTNYDIKTIIDITSDTQKPTQLYNILRAKWNDAVLLDSRRTLSSSYKSIMQDIEIFADYLSDEQKINLSCYFIEQMKKLNEKFEAGSIYSWFIAAVCKWSYDNRTNDFTRFKKVFFPLHGNTTTDFARLVVLLAIDYETRIVTHEPIPSQKDLFNIDFSAMIRADGDEMVKKMPKNYEPIISVLWHIWNNSSISNDTTEIYNAFMGISDEKQKSMFYAIRDIAVT